MSKPQPDPEREERISMEIIVDAYGPGEQALGWYYYLESSLAFPFTARCIERRAISPLELGDEVEVVGMPPEEECEREMFVSIRRKRRAFAVPLVQLQFVHADENPEETTQAIADWHYWLARGYCF